MLSNADIAAWVGAYLWPLFRVMGMFSIAPVVGAPIVPMRIRLSLALAVSLAISPAIAQPELGSLTYMGAIVIALQQVLIGVAMGFVMRMVFSAIELGAQVIALQMGLGFAELIDPQGGAQVPTLAQFYVMIATLVFLALDGHHRLLELLLDSFRALPLGGGGIGREGFWALVSWAGDMFRGAVLVALTATVALVSVNVLIGVMTRAVPQFNMFVAFPAILLLGFLIVALNISALSTQLSQLILSAFEMIQLQLFEGV